MDYIFYRVYWAYHKKGESAKILTTLYMTMVIAFLFFPLALFLCELLRDPWRSNDGYLLLIYLLTVFLLLVFKIFSKQKNMPNKQEILQKQL